MFSKEEIEDKYKKLEAVAQQLKNQYGHFSDMKSELSIIRDRIEINRSKLILDANDKEVHPELKNAESRNAFIETELDRLCFFKELSEKNKEILKQESDIKGLEIEFRALRVVLETYAQLISTLNGKEKGYGR